MPPAKGTTGSAATAAAVFAGVRVTLVARGHRRLHRLLDEPATTLTYNRFVDARGTPGLALFLGDRGAAPDVVVPLLAYAPDLVPAPLTGRIDVHGEVGDGCHLLPVSEGQPLWPLGPALAFPSAAIRELVGGG